MVGPFFYINSSELQYRGFLYHADLEDNAERQLKFLTSKVGHAELFDKRFPHTQIEYYDFPRGRVVYDTGNHQHIIYIDSCIKSKTEAISNLFNTDNYVVKNDEHYICENCISENIFD